MAKTLNKQLLIGHVGSTPEIRTTAGGKKVANFSVATSERVQRNGNWEDIPEWHRLVAWDKVADIVEQLVQKGTLVYIEGRTETNAFTDNAGVERKEKRVIIREISILSGGKENPNGTRGNGAARAQASRPAPAAAAAAPDDDGDDLPF